MWGKLDVLWGCWELGYFEYLYTMVFSDTVLNTELGKIKGEG